jgi:hypothetical protein
MAAPKPTKGKSTLKIIELLTLSEKLVSQRRFLE